ncbi:MAG: restriction endonuclease [Candidatus Nomurabacteria bacterium]|jgi:type II restriction enzyme|nr:restriction endonuclease [Candidatus Nomurabacteria bacterium]
MELVLDFSIAKVYKNNSQRIRVITESWTSKNIYCSYCGKQICQYENNRPVADFYCNDDHEEYELKSKAGKIVSSILAGSYDKMIERITSEENPNLFLLSYFDKSVNNFCVIPKYLLTPSVIKKRKPLTDTARRAGWVGCNILVDNIPEIGKIFYVKNGIINDKRKVLEQFNKIAFLKQEKIESKGWILDVLKVVDEIGKDDFTLKDVYDFEQRLAKLHPDNNNVKAKIRQQLQILRNKGVIDFVSNGNYRRIK